VPLHFYKWLGMGRTVNRRTANKKTDYIETIECTFFIPIATEAHWHLLDDVLITEYVCKIKQICMLLYYAYSVYYKQRALLCALILT